MTAVTKQLSTPIQNLCSAMAIRQKVELTVVSACGVRYVLMMYAITASTLSSTSSSTSTTPAPLTSIHAAAWRRSLTLASTASDCSSRLHTAKKSHMESRCRLFLTGDCFTGSCNFPVSCSLDSARASKPNQQSGSVAESQTGVRREATRAG